MRPSSNIRISDILLILIVILLLASYLRTGVSDFLCLNEANQIPRHNHLTFFIRIIPGGEPGAAPIVNLGEIDGDSVEWDTNVAAGTSVQVEVRDSTGETVFSAPFTIQNSGKVQLQLFLALTLIHRHLN